MPTSVYIAAPFERILQAREARRMLQEAGFTVTSSWLDAEHSATFAEADTDLLMYTNYGDLDKADILLVLSYEGLGGEMHVEAGDFMCRTPLNPVYWVGSNRPLSAYRHNVTRLNRLDEAVERMKSDVYGR